MGVKNSKRKEVIVYNLVARESEKKDHKLI